ncbi:prolipoprotein diacylglyceryl transferase [Aliikangiella sp. IMCC44359]|uniref:prolipoprotein diacylglyceryl transferase n=1 Tax=Aliikangiella sp. IMCC44359 TaxID=3459125 RepID=UPI00403AAC37
MFPYLYQSTDLTIGTYGVMLAIAYLIGRHIYTNRLLSISKNINTELLILSLLIFGVVGAKLMFLLKNPEEGALTSWETISSGSGFSSQGAIFSAIIVVVIFSKFSKVKLHILLDNAAPAAILAYAIARVGCFLAGDECHGIQSDLPWAMSFPNGIKKALVPVHPVPLYEIFYSLIIWQYINHLSQKGSKPYYMFFSLLFLWGVCRFFIEFVSTNPIKLLGMSGSQFGALIMFICASTFFISSYLYSHKKAGINPAKNS